MKTEILNINGYDLKVYSVNTVVVGSGAAGFNAIDRLFSYGCKDTVLVTEGINAGTSRNTGSDKQTYYKLTLSGDGSDSVEEMAKTLFAGYCMDGDIALAEAANSVPAFLHLCELGVPFPTNRFGEYIGYKTDHDPRTRGTSVGPLTSKHMTEALEGSVKRKNIDIIDNALVVKMIVKDNEFKGLILLNKKAASREELFFAIAAKNVVWATGGPAGIYKDSVFPLSHSGMSGVPFEAGVRGKNLTEWQFGIASVNPRWNVSGTYMQALPRFISTDQDGNDEKEFLSDFFKDDSEQLSKVFLKGYQWPFDVRKIDGGSSIIDILVYIECCLKHRRVFLDYRSNLKNMEIDFSRLSDESHEYLEKAGACFGRPIDRLLKMNTPAVEFYRSRGVDLEKEALEVAVCAQHNNGGLDIDAWWQTNVKGVFAAGEVAGTHGVYRPGGSALNSGQVGSMRAARYIAAKETGMPDKDGFEALCSDYISGQLDIYGNAKADKSNVSELWNNAKIQMSLIGGPIRDIDSIPDYLESAKKHLADFASEIKITDAADLAAAYHYRDALICQIMYLGAMLDYSRCGGKSRGSAMYRNPEGKCPYRELPDLFTYIVDDGEKNDVIQLAEYNPDHCIYTWRDVRPIPAEDSFFENVWRTFREDENIR